MTQLEKFFTDQGLRPLGTFAHWGVKGMKWGIRNDSAKSKDSINFEKLNQELDQNTQKYADAGDYSEEARQKSLDEREAIFRKYIKDPVDLAATLKRYVIRHSDSHSDVQSFLAHWGVKGMRWGIRRSDDELARASKSSSPDAIRARETLDSIKSSKSLSVASDADLNHLISRINTEKRYTDITSSKPASTSSSSSSTKSSSSGVLKLGHSAVKSLLGVGDTMNKAYTFANSPAGRIVAAQLGLIKATGKHGSFPTTVIDLPTTNRRKIGKHSA